MFYHVRFLDKFRVNCFISCL